MTEIRIAYTSFRHSDQGIGVVRQAADAVRVAANEMIESVVCSSSLGPAALQTDVFETRPSAVPGANRTRVGILSRPWVMERSADCMLPPNVKKAVAELIESATQVLSSWGRAIDPNSRIMSRMVCSGVRVLRYPPRAFHETQSPALLPPHLDESSVSIVCPGGGLEVHDGEWRRASVHSAHLLVGDRFPREAGFRVEPTWHRVVQDQSEARVSVVVFYDVWERGKLAHAAIRG